MDWESLFSGRPDRRILPLSRRVDRYRSLAGVSFDLKHVNLPAGLLAEHRVNRFLIENLSPASYVAGDDFDRLPIPFRAVATDLATGDLVVLAKGDLARAARASMSIPLVFPPVEWEGRNLVDGLVVNNLPVDVAKAFSPRVLVAIDIASPPMEPADYASALGIATQVNDLLTRRRYRDFQAEPDVLVRPDLGEHSAVDYSGFDELIQKGYEATKAAIPEIRRKLEAAGVTDLAPRPRAGRATGARGRDDPRGGRPREREGQREARARHLQRPRRPALFDGEGAAGVRQGGRHKPCRSDLDGVRAGRRRGADRAARDRRPGFPGGGRGRLHGVGARARERAPAQQQPVRLRRGDRGAGRRERRGEPWGADAARREAPRERHRLPRARVRGAGQAALLRRGRRRGQPRQLRAARLRLRAARRAAAVDPGRGRIPRGSGGRDARAGDRHPAGPRPGEHGLRQPDLRHPRRPPVAGAGPSIRRERRVEPGGPRRRPRVLERVGGSALQRAGHCRSWACTSTASRVSRAATCPSTTGTGSAGRRSSRGTATRS